MIFFALKCLVLSFVKNYYRIIAVLKELFY
jgi:hypothetical protein